MSTSSSSIDDNTIDEDKISDNEFNYTKITVNKPQVIDLYKKAYNLSDNLLCTFNDETIKLFTIESINIESLNIIVKDDLSQLYELIINSEMNIILNTENYNITEIENVTLMDESEIEDILIIQLTESIYPEILLETIEIDEMDYITTNYEKKENFIYEMLQSYNIYDDDHLISQISTMADEFIYLLSNTYNVVDYKFNLLNENKGLFYDWIIPITNNYNKIYVDEKLMETDEDIKIESGYFKTVFEKELYKINTLLNNSENTYLNIIDILYKNEFNSTKIVDKSIGYPLNYNGTYVLNCLESNCISINGEYSVDNRKTRNKLQINNKELVGKEKINIVGFIIDNDNIFNKINNIIDSDLFSISEKCLFNTKKYTINSINSKIRELIQLGNYKIQTTNIDRTKYDNSLTFININDKYNNQEEFYNALQEYLPNKIELLNLKNKNIYKYITNYADLDKLLVMFNINHTKLPLKVKKKMNKLIQDNVNKYIQLIKPIKTTLDKITYDKIDMYEKFDIIFKFINSLTNINKQNLYRNKLINNYGRMPERKENPNFIYNTVTNDILMCKHYLYSTKITNDNTLYDTMMTKFNGLVVDGHVTCRYCNTYLDIQEFSEYDQGGPESNNFREKAPEVSEINKLDNLDNDGKSTLSLIQLISSSFGIKMVDKEIIDILELYDIIKNDDLVKERYESSDNHPLIQKALLENDRKSIKTVQKMLLDSNKLLFIMVVTLIYIQTNTNYVKVGYNSVQLLIFEGSEYTINTDYIFTIHSKIISLTELYDKSKFWNNISMFLKEDTNKLINNNINRQIFNTINYLISPMYPVILNKIEHYKVYGLQNKKYINNYWFNYRPNDSSKTIVNINEIIDGLISKNQSILLKKNDTYNLENIGIITEIDNIYKMKAIYKYLNIDVINILNNYSFIQLYRYTILLYGIQENNLYINLLVNRFINTINDTNINSIFSKNNWKINTINNEFVANYYKNEISFINLKKIIYEIINLYSKTDSYKLLLNIFVYYTFTNYDLLMLNSNMSRYDKYNTFSVYSNDVKLNSIFEQLLQLYCTDINNETIKQYQKKITLFSKGKEKVYNFDVLYTNLELNVNLQINKCKSKINLEYENVLTIIYNNHLKNKLPNIYFNQTNLFNIYSIYDINEILEQKSNINQLQYIVNTYNDNKKLYINYIQNLYLDVEGIDINYNIDINFDNVINRFTYLLSSPINDTYFNYWEDTFSQISSNIAFNIKTITSYIKNIDNSLITNKNVDAINLSIYLEDMFTQIDSNTSYSFTNNIKMIISRLKNNNNRTSLGCNLNSNIPKNWKLSDNNISFLQTFIDNNEFLIHDSVYLSNKYTYDGFNQYKDKNYEYIIFEELFNNLHIYTNFINLVDVNENINDNRINLNINNINDINKYILTTILVSIVQNINKLSENILGDNLNPLYISLQEEYNLQINDIINILNNLLLDILQNIITEFYDPNWIIYIDKNKTLQNKITTQKEKEKQKVIEGLEEAGDNRRLTLHKCGIDNLYKDMSKQANDYVNSELFKEQNATERDEILRNIYNSHNNTDDKLPLPNIDDDAMTREDEAYDMGDADQEDDEE